MSRRSTRILVPRRARSPRTARGLVTLFATIGAAWVFTDHARADEAARPPTWDMSLEELQAIGLGQSRGNPVPVPADAPKEGTRPAAGGAQSGVIFVNFDGGTMISGWDDSHVNQTQIAECVGPFAAYGDGAKREAVLQAVQVDWSPFAVLVTDDRPASGDYTMNMTGPSNPFQGNVLGIAPVDCNDEQTHNNITYAFHSINDNFSAAVTATTIGQEVAHSYGLEHVDEPADIMNPSNAGGDATFRDECIPIVQNLYCPAQHLAVCGQETMQNSYQELMNLFGPSEPDTSAPAVAIVAPSDGQQFVTGSSFEISVEATDDMAVAQVLLFNNGTQVESDTSSPWGWDVSNVPAGTYEFYVEATDQAGNLAASDTVTVTVSDDAMPTDPADGGDDGAADDGGDDAADDGAADDGGPASAGDDEGAAGESEGDEVWDADNNALPPGFGEDGEAGGCLCAASDVGGGRAWPLVLLVFLRPRLRARSRPRRRTAKPRERHSLARR